MINLLVFTGAGRSHNILSNKIIRPVVTDKEFFLPLQ